MGFFNPYGTITQFMEESITPLPPQIVSETITFDLTESVTVPTNNPAAISETITFDLTESVTVTT